MRRWASEHMKKKLTGTGGPALVSAYNVMTQVRPLPRHERAGSLGMPGQGSACMHPSTCRQGWPAALLAVYSGIQRNQCAELHLHSPRRSMAEAPACPTVGWRPAFK